MLKKETDWLLEDYFCNLNILAQGEYLLENIKSGELQLLRLKIDFSLKMRRIRLCKQLEISTPVAPKITHSLQVLS